MNGPAPSTTVRPDLAICTTGRKQSTADLLRSHAALDLFSSQTLICQGMVKGHPLLNVARQEQYRCILDSEVGVSAARNLALCTAQSRYLLMLDDDVEISAHTVRMMLRSLQSEGLAILAVRPVEPADALPVTARRSQSRVYRKVDAGIFDDFWEGALLVDRQAVAPLTFDTRLGVGTSTSFGSDEGPDLAIRMVLAGQPVGYEADLTVTHHDPTYERSNDVNRRRWWSYAVGRGGAVRKHRMLRSRLFTDLLRPLGGALFSLGRADRDSLVRYIARVAGFAYGYLLWSLKCNGPGVSASTRSIAYEVFEADS